MCSSLHITICRCSGIIASGSSLYIIILLILFIENFDPINFTKKSGTTCTTGPIFNTSCYKVISDPSLTFENFFLQASLMIQLFMLQVSHHPPISVFHVTNRRDGFNISGSILARSKFYGMSEILFTWIGNGLSSVCISRKGPLIGSPNTFFTGNSLSAILDGVATLTFLERGEDYFITMPFAHCKGWCPGFDLWTFWIFLSHPSYDKQQAWTPDKFCSWAKC